MRGCAVNGCPNHSGKGSDGEKFSLHRIPNVIRHRCDVTRQRSERRRAAWLTIINENILPESEIEKLRVCSAHFVSGAPCSLHLEENVDWMPSLHLGTSTGQPAESRDGEALSVASTVHHSPSALDSSGPSVSSAVLQPLSLNFNSPASSSDSPTTVLPQSSKYQSQRCSEETSLLKCSSKFSTIQTEVQTPTSSTSSKNAATVLSSPLQIIRAGTQCAKVYRRASRRSLLSESNRSSVSDLDSSDTSGGLEDSFIDDSDLDLSRPDVSHEALSESVCLQRSEYENLEKNMEILKRELEEEKSKVRKFQDGMTDLTVDKLELQRKLESSEQTVGQLRNIINNMEEKFEEDSQKKVAELMQSHEQLLLKREAEFEKIKKVAMEADALTFRKLDDFSTCEAKVKFYTGLPNYGVFNSLLNYVVKTALEGKSFERCALQPWQNLLMTLMRLRLALTLQDLAFRFGVHVSTVTKNFDLWLDALYVVICPALICWPDRETLWDTTPREFYETYGKSVAVIIDCFEVFTDKPSALDTRGMVWSNYKHHHTVKILIGIAPFGAITFVSDCYGARASDKTVVAESGLYELLLPYDAVMADRGFDIAQELAMNRAKLLIPAFTRGQDQLSSHDVTLTRQIANLRVHVERVIGLVRRKYRILKSIIPVNMLVTKEGDSAATIDKIVRVCCALTNLSPSVVSHPDCDPLTSESEEEQGGST